MRINHKPEPEDGEHRIRSGFLWFPKRIGNQTRWLEYAKWSEIYTCFEYGEPFFAWEGLCWLEEK